MNIEYTQLYNHESKETFMINITCTLTVQRPKSDLSTSDNYGTILTFINRDNYMTQSEKQTINSSEDKIANVNFLHDDIVHALQNSIDLCINSARDRSGYVLECRFKKSVK